MNRKTLARKAIASLFMSMLCLLSYAQTRQVTGLVTDANGEPMIGVNVTVVGTTNGTITDIDGNYSLSVASNAKLQFSFIGYLSKTVEVGTQKQINVKLVEDSKTLDEVVVVGYGTMKKTDIAMIILIAGVCAAIAFVIANQIPALKVDTTGDKVPTTEAIETTVVPPSSEVFSGDGINPTIQTVIGGESSTDE
jgi:hypothetical protein